MDVWWWRRTSSGIFDTRSFYCALSLTSQVEPSPWKGVWGVKAPRRVAFFVWTIVWGKILTMDNLRRCGYVLAGWCCMCRANGESVDHLFLHCPVAAGLWNFGVKWVISGRFRDLLFSWQNWFGKHSLIWNMVPACLLWTLWTERNRRIFEECECSESQLVESFCISLYHWSHAWGFTSSSSLVSFIMELGLNSMSIPL